MYGILSRTILNAKFSEMRGLNYRSLLLCKKGTQTLRFHVPNQSPAFAEIALRYLNDSRLEFFDIATSSNTFDP